MLFLRELIEKSLTDAGLVFTTEEKLGYPFDRITRDIFIPLLGEYGKWFPAKKSIDVLVTTYQGLILPLDFVKPLTLNYRNFYVAEYMYQPVMPVPESLWRIQNGRLYVEFPGRYDFEYIYNRVPKHDVVDKVIATNESSRLFLTAYLPSDPRSGTVTFNLYEWILTPDPNTGAITGSIVLKTQASDDLLKALGITDRAALIGTEILNAVGLYNCTTWKVDITLDMAYKGDLKTSYYSVGPYVSDLTWDNEPFYKMWKVRFLVPLATTKSLMDLQNMPVNINADDLLAYVRGIEADLPELINDRQEWWNW